MIQEKKNDMLMKRLANLEKKVVQTSKLINFSNILNSTLEQKEVIRRAMEAATSLMEAEVGSLLLIDEKTNELFFEVALGEKGEEVKEVRLKMGEGIAGWVVEHGKPLLINDVQNDSRFCNRVDQKSKFITKSILCVPVKIKDKTIGVFQAVNKLTDKSFEEDEIELFNSLANQVAIAIENAKLYEELQEAFLSTAEALADAIEQRDPYTGGHTMRVLTYSIAMAKYLSMTPDEIEKLRLAAILHDIGKIGIIDKILQKEARLDEQEFKIMQSHPSKGSKILNHVKQLKDVTPGVQSHHERVDGKGYPHGLSNNKIPLIARIIAVADTFDAMTTDRPYRKGLSDEAALNELKRCSGSQFDEKIVKSFLKAYNNGEIKN